MHGPLADGKALDRPERDIGLRRETLAERGEQARASGPSSDLQVTQTSRAAVWREPLSAFRLDRQTVIARGRGRRRIAPSPAWLRREAIERSKGGGLALLPPGLDPGSRCVRTPTSRTKSLEAADQDLSTGHLRSLAAPPAASRNFRRTAGLLARGVSPAPPSRTWMKSSGDEKRRHAAHSRGGGHGSAKSLPCSLFTLWQDRGTVRDLCSASAGVVKGIAALEECRLTGAPERPTDIFLSIRGA